mgnify:CR=1 FL=1
MATLLITIIPSLLIITFLLFINFLLRAIDRFLGKGLEILTILEYLFLNLAWIIALSVPMAVLLSTLMTFGRLSEDNEIVFSAPISTVNLFFMRYISGTIYTSWMMIIFSLPIFATYGIVFQTPVTYWFLMVPTLLSITLTSTCLSTLLTIVLVKFFPARHTKDIILYLSLCFGVLIIFLIRLLQPEDMVYYDKYGHLVDYLSKISKPVAPYLPASWASNFLSLYLLDLEIDWLLFSLILLTPIVLYILGEWCMKVWFFSGYSKSQESFGGTHRFAKKQLYKPGIWKWIFNKESKVFLRDSVEWSQLFMIAALVVIYLYNFKLIFLLLAVN